MVYGIVALVLLFSSIKGYSGKRTSCLVQTTADAIRFNLLRMLICILIGAALVFLEGAQRFLAIEAGMLWICVLAGGANAAFLIGWLLAVQKNAMVSVDVGLTLGSLLPAVLCAILFTEPISVPKMLGFALILVATAILAGHSKQTVNGGLGGALLLVFAAVGEGMSSFAQQLYKQFYTDGGSAATGTVYPKTVYHFYTYVFAALALLLALAVYLLLQRRHTKSAADGKRTAGRIPPRALVHILVMAICLFAANYFQTVATNDYGMSSQMLYPLLKGGCLITVNITAMLFFGEKITKRSVLGSLVALAGIIVMSIL
ncbi:MAG: hypothetical protein IJW30_02785 [Clostridia bacterium]|nr:hypothetical protein [Clostridia bacterium]